MTIVPFYLLDPSFMKQIVTLRLDKLADRLRESHKMQLSYSKVVLECIAERCSEVETGKKNAARTKRSVRVATGFSQRRSYRDLLAFFRIIALKIMAAIQSMAAIIYSDRV